MRVHDKEDNALSEGPMVEKRVESEVVETILGQKEKGNVEDIKAANSVKELTMYRIN